MFCKWKIDEAARKNRLEQYIRLFEKEVNRIPQNNLLIQDLFQSINYFKSQDLIQIEPDNLSDKSPDHSMNPLLKNNPSPFVAQRQDFSEPRYRNTQELQNKPFENFNRRFPNEQKRVQESKPSLNNQSNYTGASIYQKSPIIQIEPYKKAGIPDYSQPKNFQQILEKNPSISRQDITKTLEKNPSISRQDITKTSSFIGENSQDTRPKDQRISSKKCSKCNADGITDECAHKLCRGCLKKEYFRISKGSFMGRMKCTECDIEIDVNKHIGVQIKKERIESIERLKRQFLLDATSSHFECQICNEQILVNESITLPCDHRFCEPCTKDFFTEKIKSNRLKEIKCPNCLKDIDYDVIRANVDKITFDLYCTLQTREYRPKDPNVYLKECYKCGQFAEIPRNLTIFTCPGCKNEYCPQCNYNHRGKSCKEYQMSTRIAYKSENLIYCPACKEAIEIDNSGCNFMKCQWGACEISFCSLCLEILDENMHYKHYKKSGPFGVTCNKLDGILDE
ncbi:hypothetical protein SteCoe_26528 [Stentor coeruleus]|uniref:RBR-type E3 ubiquitin transferase n=1 Tax=Stentor coeruleus TaxID=5963 RepID=A0A1R2BCN4_9CILI|nr:hypothetical protein SteCoe_26528 [Stentor coeruleus]